MNVESSITEFKREYTPDIKTEIVAFANTNGGVILVGIDDDGIVIGIKNADETLNNITNMVRDSIQPDITMFVNYEILPTSVIRINVQEGTNKPYYLSGKGINPSGVYVRQGTSSAHSSWDQIRLMIKLSDGDKFEDERCFEQNLTFTEATEEFKKHEMDFTANKYIGLGIQNSNNLFSNLGMLLSDQCKHTIKVAVFDGNEKKAFKDRKEFSGSVLKQLHDAYDYLYLSNKTQSTISGLNRTDSKDYPDDAIREALLNAIVHRDYSFSGSIIINIYDNRIEFISMGGLVYGLNTNDIMMGISQTRNEKLAAIFFRLGHIEAYGTGIQKIFDLYGECYKKPGIKVSDSAFVLELPNMNYYKHDSSLVKETAGKSYGFDSVKAPNSQQEKVINYIKNKGSLKPEDIQTLLGVKQTRSYAIVKEMVSEGFIKVEGKGINKRYVMGS